MFIHISKIKDGFINRGEIYGEIRKGSIYELDLRDSQRNIINLSHSYINTGC